MRFNHSGHKALWNWLADNPNKDKRDWPGWEQFCATDDCFACEYVGQGGCPGMNCGRKCSLIWPDGTCGKNIGLFHQWEDAEGIFKKRSALAAQIRDLPVREGVECD